MPEYVLGIYPGHDANVTVADGEGRLVLAVGEPSFSRIKDHMGFPTAALDYAAGLCGTAYEAILAVRMSKYRKVLRDAHFFFRSIRRGLYPPNPVYIVKGYLEKLKKGRIVEHAARQDTTWLLDGKRDIRDVGHHASHAASGYYWSGFPDALVVSLDGQGDDRYSATICRGRGAEMKLERAYFLNEMTVGPAYILTTAMLGFHGGRHAGKVTGLASHEAVNEACIREMEKFFTENWYRRPRGGHLTYSNYLMYEPEGRKALQEIRRERFGRYTPKEIAYAIQHLTERAVLDMIREQAGPDIPSQNITLGGGVFGNVRLNQKIKELGFKNIFVQPAMGDNGLSIGAVGCYLGENRGMTPRRLAHVYYGPGYDNDIIKQELDRSGVPYTHEDDIELKAAELLARGHVVARFQGRLEFGPRALGNRSILYQATDPTVNDWLNQKLKRTEFMPFAPVTLAEHAEACYENIEGAEYTAKFMNITFNCTDRMKKTSPAVVHVDGTARPQILSREDNPSYYEILHQYHRLTGMPTLINTSFNMHEEPIVCTPADAVRSFRQGHLDYLAIGNYLVSRQELKR
jgi:carbamoyltransferase